MEWNKVSFYKCDENGLITSKKIVDIIEVDQAEQSNVIIYPAVWHSTKQKGEAKIPPHLFYKY